MTTAGKYDYLKYAVDEVHFLNKNKKVSNKLIEREICNEKILLDMHLKA